MFWLFRKILEIGVLVAVLYFVLQFPVGGRPLRSYLVDFYHSPIFQEGVRQGKEALQRYLQKDVGSKGDSESPAMEKLSDEEKKELEEVLEKESR